jgi:hypothetical protein
MTLPVQVSSRTDVGRLQREMEALDNFLTQAAIREPGTPMKLPKTSRLLDEFINTNQLNPLHDEDRARMLAFIKQVRDHAPVLHISFGADPSAIFVEKLTAWLRKELHPTVMMHVGLQPNIGAGCIVRTTNKQFDFSLRQHFRNQRPLLVQKLHGTIQAVPTPAPAAVEEVVTT